MINHRPLVLLGTTCSSEASTQPGQVQARGPHWAALEANKRKLLWSKVSDFPLLGVLGKEKRLWKLKPRIFSLPFPSKHNSFIRKFVGSFYSRTLKEYPYLHREPQNHPGEFLENLGNGGLNMEDQRRI